VIGNITPMHGALYTDRSIKGIAREQRCWNRDGGEGRNLNLVADMKLLTFSRLAKLRTSNAPWSDGKHDSDAWGTLQ